MKVFFDFFLTPIYYIFMWGFKLISKLYGYKKLKHNSLPKELFSKSSRISFLDESPKILTNLHSENLNQIRTQTLYFNDKDLGIGNFSFTGVASLDDRFCSFPKENKFLKNRINKILIVRTKKNYLEGHKLRVRLSEKLKNNPKFEILNLSKRNISDLYEVYKKYKYVLITENYHQEGYITEKVFDVIKSGAIPIFHHKNIGDFKYCYCSFKELDNEKDIINTVNNFEKKFKWEACSNQNFISLKKLRKTLILKHLSSFSVPYFYFAKYIHFKTPLFKLYNFALKNLKNLFWQKKS